MRRDLGDLARAFLRQSVPDAAPAWARHRVLARPGVGVAGVAPVRTTPSAARPAGRRRDAPPESDMHASVMTRPSSPATPPPTRTRRYGLRLPAVQHDFLMSFARRHGVPASAVSRSLLRLLEADPDLARRLDIDHDPADHGPR